MATENTFKFPCPHCGQHLDAEYDMIGMTFDCPACGQPLTVPEIVEVPHGEVILCESEASCHSQDTKDKAEAVCPAFPVITVIRKRERFFDKCKNRIKAVGIGVAVLLLFVGVGVIKATLDKADVATTETDKTEDKAGFKTKAVATSIECLLNYIDLPNDRRLQVLSKSLESCPEDFQVALKEFLVSASRTSDDMISDREREEMVKGRAVLGLLFGAANQNDPQGGVSAGLQLGDLLCAEVKEKANRKLKREIEAKLTHLIEVAEKYGIDPNKLESALVGRFR